jgi:four helix bundle protein
MSNFKSNNVRHRAYKFSLTIIHLVKKFSKDKVYLIFTDQLLRSSTSIGANLIEAKSSSSKKEFARYYEIALKSSNEALYWLYLLKDGKLVNEKELER